jgi:hypothetical protein
VLDIELVLQALALELLEVLMLDVGLVEALLET